MDTERKDTQDRHEIPVGVRYNRDQNDRRRHGSLVDNRPLHGPHQRPQSELEAIMQTPPMVDPQVSWDETPVSHLGEMLAILDPKERSVVELVVIGQMTLSEAGWWLGLEYGRSPFTKQWVQVLEKRALAKLRKTFGFTW